MMSPEEMNRNAEEILSSISGKELTAKDRAAIPQAATVNKVFSISFFIIRILNTINLFRWL